VTWLEVHPVVVVLAAAITAALVIAWAWHRWIRAASAAVLERELDREDPTITLEIHHERASSDVAAGSDEGPDLLCMPGALHGPEEQDAGKDDLVPERAQDTSGTPVPAVRMTPAQRRRAVHKGRIPRDLPGPAAAAAMSPGQATSSGVRAGELHFSRERILSATEAAELSAAEWLLSDADRIREDESRRAREDLEAAVNEAYAEASAGFAALEATDWLALAA
jgi:hypothetical protein